MQLLVEFAISCTNKCSLSGDWSSVSCLQRKQVSNKMLLGCLNRPHGVHYTDDWLCWQRSTRPIFLLEEHTYSVLTDQKLQWGSPARSHMEAACWSHICFLSGELAELSELQLHESWPQFFWINTTCSSGNKHSETSTLFLLGIKYLLCYDMIVHIV